MRNAHTRAIVCLAILLVSCACAFALDPSLDISQYAHTSWKVRDGFTKGQITAIAQTPDGYLWLGTDFGLYRFDGVRAVPWQPPAGHQLPSDYIVNLFVARDGTLWIATNKGLASLKNGEVTSYAELSGLTILAVLEDHEGTLWVGGMSLSGSSRTLWTIRGSTVQSHGDGSFARGVVSLCEDAKNNLWVLADHSLWHWSPGAPERFATGLINGFVPGDSGEILLAASGRLQQLVDGRIQDYRLPGGARFTATRFLRSKDGSLWIASQAGLWRLHQGTLSRFTAADGLSADYVHRIFEDREGNVWVATAGGLDRFRELAVPNISTKQGMVGSASAVQATADGSIWMGSITRLVRWQSGHATIYKAQNASTPEVTASEAPIRVANSGLPRNPLSLGQDDQGGLWASTPDGMYRFGGSRFVRVPGIPSGEIWGITGDGQGGVWSVNSGLGLLRWTADGGVQEVPLNRLTQKAPWAMGVDRKHGGLWLGFVGGGVVHFKDGKVRASYSVADGLGGGRVVQFRFGPRGALWAATEGGLSRIEDGHVTTLTSKNGLPCDTVHWSMEDDDHQVWLYMACGLVRVARSELDAWVSNPNRKLQAFVLDNSDGVPAVAIAGGYGPRVTKSQDGRIWFTQQDGIGVFDPHHLAQNKLPPPVHIEQVTADDKTYDATSGLRLPPHVRNLDIDYTALSLIVPEKVRFRVKLEGQDKDWRELVNVRHVEYTNLSPKHYRFRVLASNNSGVWNEEGASLEFVIPPAWYQTNWFYAVCVATFLVLLWAAYQLRVRQLAYQFNMRLEERVGERTRIARDLHDTLLQSFHGTLLRFQTAYDLLPTRPTEAKQSLGTAIDQAAEAITEGRDAIQGLRASTVEKNDLARAINALAGELAADTTNPAVCHVAVEGTSRNLHPILRDEVYRIAGEALRNAFQHAQARLIEVEVHYDERRLRLRVRDDGVGIDRKFLSEEGRPGHFGLHGMRERAQLVGGKLTVWSELDSGTELELSIPASIAYAASSTRRRFWRSDKGSSESRSEKETDVKS